MKPEIETTQKARLGGFLRVLHRWAGAVLGAYVCVMGLTGSVLAFQDEINRWEWSRRLPPISAHGRPRAPASALVAAMKRAYPNLSETDLAGVPLPARPDVPVVFYRDWGDNPARIRAVYVDPYDARVVGDFPLVRTVTGFALLAHSTLLGGSRGTLATGCFAGATLVLLVSGAWLYRPSAWRKPSGALGWHSASGAVAFPVLLLLAATGAYFVLDTPLGKPVARLVYALTKTSPDAPPAPLIVRPPRPNAPTLSLDELVRRANDAPPRDARVTSVARPFSATSPFTAYKTITDGRFLTYASVTLDPYTGRVLRVSDARESSRGRRILASVGPLHYGWWGGWFSKTLYALAGLAPTALLATGLLSWRNRRRNSKAR